MYTKGRHLSSLRHFGDCRVLCTFSKIPAAAAAGIAIEQVLARAGGTVRLGRRYGPPITVQTLFSRYGHGKAPCWVGSLCGLRSLWRRHHITKGHALWIQRTFAQMYVIVWKLQCIVPVYCVLRVPLGRKIHCVDGI